MTKGTQNKAISGINILLLIFKFQEETVLKINLGTFLVAQLLRIHLPMEDSILVREDPTCHRATKHMHHNNGACMLQLLQP